jgi:hypothetical protein
MTDFSVAQRPALRRVVGFASAGPGPAIPGEGGDSGRRLGTRSARFLDATPLHLPARPLRDPGS